MYRIVTAPQSFHFVRTFENKIDICLIRSAFPTRCVSGAINHFSSLLPNVRYNRWPNLPYLGYVGKSVNRFNMRDEFILSTGKKINGNNEIAASSSVTRRKQPERASDNQSVWKPTSHNAYGISVSLSASYSVRSICVLLVYFEKPYITTEPLSYLVEVSIQLPI